MKKTFVIGLVFVVVILGILIAIAVPRFIDDRKNDAIMATTENIHMLLNDISVYYVTKGSFGEFDNVINLKWNAFTNVPLVDSDGDSVNNENIFEKNGERIIPKEVFLKVGKNNQCIGFELYEKTLDRSAVVKFSDTKGKSDSLCDAVRSSKPVRDFTHNVLVCDGCIENGEEGYLCIGT